MAQFGQFSEQMTAVQNALKRRGMNLPPEALNQFSQMSATPTPPMPQIQGGGSAMPRGAGQQQPQPQEQVGVQPNPEAEIILKAMASRLKQLT